MAHYNNCATCRIILNNIFTITFIPCIKTAVIITAYVWFSMDKIQFSNLVSVASGVMGADVCLDQWQPGNVYLPNTNHCICILKMGLI